MDIERLKDQVKERLKDIKEYSTEYILRGFIEVEDWYGDIGFFTLNIHTNEEGFKEIQKDPLQDYTGYGVQSVNYAYFEVTKEITLETDNLRIIFTKDLEPIEVGERQGDYDFTYAFFNEPYEIYY